MTRRRALISVSDKRGLENFARGLHDLDFEIVSTGGTARRLEEAGIPVTGISDVTGHPEIMDGRVKTLHPAVHGGLLARTDHAGDREQLDRLGYGLIDLVAVNLYPFRETVASGDVSTPVAMEKVDIGGPTMIRAAAKNHDRVWVIVDPDDYPLVLDRLASGESAAETRRTLARKVFDHVSTYDAAIADYLAEPTSASGISLPQGVGLRYGENPDQAAAFHALDGGRHGIGGLEQLHGKALSYNNYLDLDGALLALAPFAWAPPAVCIVKHTTPCGLATADSLAEAYDLALRTDPLSAFGSVIACNRPVDLATAERMTKRFVECVVAPAFEPGALAALTRKKNLRLLVMPEVSADPSDLEALTGGAPLPDEAAAAGDCSAFLALHGRKPDAVVLRSVYGGVLSQSAPVPPFVDVAPPKWEVVTKRAPTATEDRDLRFAWAAVFSVKSNAILLARDGATLGIGAGQMSRVDASKLAVTKAASAGIDLAGCVFASDAFFPFRDGVDAAAEAGATAVVQPGGSIRDEEVIAAADEHGLAMVFTGRRLFRH